MAEFFVTYSEAVTFIAFIGLWNCEIILEFILGEVGQLHLVL